MKSHYTPTQSVIHSAELCHRGIICPGEAWYRITDVIGESDVENFMSGLTLDERNLVKMIHRERPESLRGHVETYAAVQPVFAHLLSWCEKATSLKQ